MPGLYGPAGVADLVPVPAATLRHVVDALNSEALESCWTDDMTLGWVYQYWNDPEREALDAKLNGGGKVEPHEIASKTQMFTERYMVDWLLQNSLGPMWLAMCQKHGWTPEVEADGTLDRLEERRAEWRAKRESGEVALTELMPLHTDAERRWAYYVPQPIPDDAVAQAPETIRDLKLLDPAVGSGHFLVVALDLLVALYREEARHRGEGRGALVRPGHRRAHPGEQPARHRPRPTGGADRSGGPLAQGAAGGPGRPARAAEPRRVEPAAREPGRRRPGARRAAPRGGARDRHPGALTDTLVHALRGADHLGSLLKVDTAVDEALERHEAVLGRAVAEQGDLFTGFKPERQSESPSAATRPRPPCSTGWRVSSRGTPAVTTSACACAASSSRRACASCGWSVRGPTTWWWRTRRTRARSKMAGLEVRRRRRTRSARQTSTRRFCCVGWSWSATADVLAQCSRCAIGCSSSSTPELREDILGRTFDVRGAR